MELSDILFQNAVRVPVKVQSKKRLLQEISEIASEVYGFSDSAVFNALMEREALGPTGVGHGVAIPHARLAEVENVCGLFLRLDTPVDFDSVDRKPVDLVFVLLAPKSAGASHLKALARVSRTLRDEAMCNKIRSTEDAAAVYSILTDESASEAA